MGVAEDGGQYGAPAGVQALGVSGLRDAVRAGTCDVRVEAPAPRDVIAGDVVTVQFAVEAPVHKWPVKLCLFRSDGRSHPPDRAAGTCLLLPGDAGAATAATAVVRKSVSVERHTEAWHLLELAVWTDASPGAGHTPAQPATGPHALTPPPDCVASVLYATVDVPTWTDSLATSSLWWKTYLSRTAAVRHDGASGALADGVDVVTAPPMLLRGLPNLLGPVPAEVAAGSGAPAGAPPPAVAAAPKPLRVLVATFAGSRTKAFVARNIGRMLSDGARCDAIGRCVDVDVLLCTYDDTDWSTEPWASSTRVVTVRASGQMKWWFVKRFMAPAVVAGYEYVTLLDDDVSLPASMFSLPVFLHTLRRHGVAIGQPSHGARGGTTFQFLEHDPAGPAVGWWTNFVECGPLLAVHTAVWPCVWDLLQPDVTSGYGYDLVWGPVCAPHNTAVLNALALLHEDVGAASSRPNGFTRMVAEGVTLFRRLRDGGWRGVPGITPHMPAMSGTIGVNERRRITPR